MADTRLAYGPGVEQHAKERDSLFAICFHEGREIAVVARDDDPFFLRRPCENVRIVGLAEPYLGNMNDVDAAFTQLCQRGRADVLVEDEAQDGQSTLTRNEPL